MTAVSTAVERHAYRGYGLELVSGLPLPQLQLATGTSADVDVTVDFVENGGPFNAVPIDVSESIARISIPGWAHFEVRDGRHIRIEAPVTAARDAGLFLLGAPLAALLYQRGLAVVRGGIVCRGDRRVLLIGHGGSGVSTLLAALLEQEWQVQCDSFVAIDQAADGSVTALPGLPVLKLWRDACERLGNVRGLDDSVRAGSSCHWVRLGERHVSRSVNPTCVIEVGFWNRDLLAETLPRRAGLVRLMGCRYHPGYGGRSSHARQFSIFTALASSVRIGRLRRPWLPFDPRAQIGPFADLLDRLHDGSTTGKA